MRTLLDLRVLRILAISALASACTDAGAPTSPTADPSPQFGIEVISEADDFAFLEPIQAGQSDGPLALGIFPTVQVCAGPPEAPGECVVLDTDLNGNHYQVNWRDRSARADDIYTVNVLILGESAGEVVLTLDGEDGTNPRRTFPIKFWMGYGVLGDVFGPDVADCIDSERCNTGVVSPGQGDIEIVTENENGATMARLLIPEGAIPGGFLVTLDCRSGGYDPGDGPLPTGLTQWPLFCHVTATDPDGEPFEVELDGDATMDICVVDEEISGQDPWHDFPDHEDLLLGKSDGPFSFELLPFAPSTLGCEGNTTPLPEEAGLGSRILRELDTRLAPAFGVLLPEGLRAAPMYFRDGGVGGLLRSFSDINPVEPAFISGTVSDGESELEGVTVTLSESFGCEGEFCEYGEGDEDVLASVETDENGLYEFGPLDTGDYVVTVECPFEYYLDAFVEVEGSGTTTVDITCELPGE